MARKWGGKQKSFCFNFFAAGVKWKLQTFSCRLLLIFLIKYPYHINNVRSFHFVPTKAAATTDTTWVTSDFIAQSSSDLSVSKGQQVEVLSLDCQGAPDFCLVRIVVAGTTKQEASSPAADLSSTQEGLVPVAILKPPPQPPNLSNGKLSNFFSVSEPLYSSICIY